MTIITKSPEETCQLAHDLFHKITTPRTISLNGPLGSGKTCFTKGLAKAANISEHVTSPTFSLVQEYEYSNGLLVHMDLYRIEDANEALNFGIEDYFCNKQALIIIEWSQNISNILPLDTIDIKFEYQSLTERKITINNLND